MSERRGQRQHKKHLDLFLFIPFAAESTRQNPEGDVSHIKFGWSWRLRTLYFQKTQFIYLISTLQSNKNARINRIRAIPDTKLIPGGKQLNSSSFCSSRVICKSWNIFKIKDKRGLLFGTAASLWGTFGSLLNLLKHYFVLALTSKWRPSRKGRCTLSTQFWIPTHPCGTMLWPIYFCTVWG